MIPKIIFLISFLLEIQCIATEQKKDLSRPNIVFCIADDASWEHMSAYGKKDWVKTPAFDRVAKEGLLFMNAYTPNAKCAPFRACILTGRNPWQLEAAANHNAYFPAKFKTFMEVFKDNGYATGYTGKGWYPGDQGKYANGKPRELTGSNYADKKLVPPTSGIVNIDYAANFDEFLNNKPADQPFIFWYGGREPHRGYEYGSGIVKGNKKLTDIKKVPPFWIDNDVVRTDMLDYAFELEYFDKQAEKIINNIERRGLLENTIVVITSDNGMPFPHVKGHMYEYDNHLTLAIMWKGKIVHPGRTIEDYLSFIDFAPTFLQAAGISIAQSGMQPIQGKSFMDIIKSTSGNVIDNARNFVLLGRERTDVGRPNDEGYPERAIIKNGFFFVRNYEPSRWPSGNPETGYMDTDGSPTKTEILSANRKGLYKNIWQLDFGKRPEYELYKISSDPYLIKSLYVKTYYIKARNKLLTEMESMLKKQGDPRMFGKGDVFDKYPYANEKVRNYYNRYMKGKKIAAHWISLTDFEKKPVK